MSETVAGASTIRAFGNEDVFKERCVKVVDKHTRRIANYESLQRWLGYVSKRTGMRPLFDLRCERRNTRFRLEVIGSIVTLATALMVVYDVNQYILPGQSGSPGFVRRPVQAL